MAMTTSDDVLHAFLVSRRLISVNCTLGWRGRISDNQHAGPASVCTMRVTAAAVGSTVV